MVVLEQEMKATVKNSNLVRALLLDLASRSPFAMRHAPIVLVLLACVPLLTGCETVHKYSLTYRLWDTEDLREWSEPAPNSNLALFATSDGNDVLVRYEALSDKHSSVRSRAYYLQQNANRVAAGKKPVFVKSTSVPGLRPIVILSFLPATNSPPSLIECAIVTKEGRAFTLIRPTPPNGSFELPVYLESAGTPFRLLATPFALAGDTVMVGAVAAVAAAIVWAHGGVYAAPR